MTMNQTLNEDRTTLVKNILGSTSQEDVKRHIYTAKKNLEENKASGHTIIEFLENTIADLKTLSPMNKSPQEWRNIQKARIFLKRTTNEVNIPAC
jgi:hypothetical protein